jgi:putative cardiolipin synthase
LYIESPELAERLVAYMATGAVRLDPNGEVIWETVTDGRTVRYQDEPDTGFRRRFVTDLLKMLPIDSQL